MLWGSILKDCHVRNFYNRPDRLITAFLQIDLLIDREDNVINVCEMKWSAEEFVIQKADDVDIRNKVASLERETKTKKAVYVTMVTTYGVKHNQYYDMIQSEVVLEQLFE